MKLKRNTSRAGKYAIIRLGELLRLRGEESIEAIQIGELAGKGFVEFGAPGAKDEFFVIKLADKYAQAALAAYAAAAAADDPEYAAEVLELAARAGPNHPNCKRPD